MAGKVTRPQKPSEVHAYFIHKCRFILALLGADVGDENYRMSLLTFFVIGCILSYWVFSIDTIIRLVRVRWVIILEASCMSFTVIQASTKLFGAIRHHRRFANACRTLRGIFAEYEIQNTGSYEALHISMQNMSQMLTKLIMWYIFTISGIFVTPFFMLLYNGERHVMLPFLVPLVDPKTDMGFWVSLMLHSVFLIVGALGLFVGDFVCIFLLASLSVFVELFKAKRKDLNTSIEEDIENSHSSRVQKRLVDLIRWHRSYIDYFQNINEFFSAMITVQIPTAGLAVGSTVFIILASDWPGAYSFFLCAVFNLYSYCIVGTIVEKWNDELCDEIYDIYWYKLNASQQKSVRLMLMLAQMQDTPKVAGYVPMTVATGLQVTKLIYSFTMFMIEFVVK